MTHPALEAVKRLDELSWKSLNLAQFPQPGDWCEVLVDGNPVSKPNKAQWDENQATFEFGFGNYLDRKSGVITWRLLEPLDDREKIVREAVSALQSRAAPDVEDNSLLKQLLHDADYLDSGGWSAERLTLKILVEWIRSQGHLSTAGGEEKQLRETLQRYIDAYPAFRMKPVGEPGSPARIEQEGLMALEETATKILARTK